MDQLVRDKVVDAQSRDEVRNQFRAAGAAKAEAQARILAAASAVAEAQARCGKACADRDAARNQLAVAQADERESKALLAYASITAPYDGVIADRRVHTGHFLQEATGGTKGEALFVVVRTDKVRVFVEVPEADAIQVREGIPGRIRVQVLNDEHFVGKVAGTSWALDPKQRTLRTEIDFPNPEEVLRPGMYVHAMIDVQRPGAWVVPAKAVLVRDSISFCYQVQDGRVQRLPLRLGLRDGDLVEVLKVQVPPQAPGAPPRWVNPTGHEDIVLTQPRELIEGQQVQVMVAKALE
jgi:RND family efflux transporter MFP subunit